MTKAKGERFGFLGVRIPERLKAELARVAKAHQRTLTDETLYALSRYVQHEAGLDDVIGWTT